MTGSNGAKGRRGLAGTWRRKGGSAAAGCQGTTTARVLLYAERCLLCSESRRPKASCEDWERIVAFLGQRDPARLPWRRPERVIVCKDCCIAALEGHRCPWWDLCWW